MEMVGSMSTTSRPPAVAIVNDYEIIVRGLSAMLAPYADRLRIVELEAGGEPSEDVDVALYDTFGGRRHSLERAEKMIIGETVRHVVLYTWDAPEEFLDDASRIGVSGIVLKSRPAADLVGAIERVVTGERVGLDVVSRGREQRSPRDLSIREREVLALVALGMSNREVADELYLSVDTVKTYVRRLYSKLGVRNRTQAALKGAGYDVHPPFSRLPLGDTRRTSDG